MENATYVAPIPEHLPDLLTDWEKYVNEPSNIPVLVRCALMHYLFATIHPFWTEMEGLAGSWSD